MKTAYDIELIKEDIFDLFMNGQRENLIEYGCLNNDITVDTLNDLDLNVLKSFVEFLKGGCL